MNNNPKKRNIFQMSLMTMLVLKMTFMIKGMSSGPVPSIRHQHHHQETQHRNSGGLRQAMPLRSAQNCSICPFRVEEDHNEYRVPAVIEQVYCTQEGSQCTEDHAFSCIQLFTNITVMYPAKEKTESFQVFHGCICGHTKGIQAPIIPYYNEST